MKRKIKEIFSIHEIQNITQSSKNIGNAEAFFAMQGANHDGNDYITEALNNGAIVVFTNKKELANERNIYYLEDTRLGFALAANLLYPSNFESIIAVTGTNGKSSVVSYLHQIFSFLRKNSASLGTLGVESRCKIDIGISPELTTYDSLSFFKILSHLSNQNVNHVIFEASSHGLEQKRLGDIKISAAGFTSFSQDHLEYHGNMDNYLEAKMQLFYQHLDVEGQCVINSDMAWYSKIAKKLEKKKIKHFSVGVNGDLKILFIEGFLEGQKISYCYLGKNYILETNIIGSFQAYNILIAAKLAHNVIGGDFDKIAFVLNQITAVKGRMQRVTGIDSDYHVFVDYAHTPDALKQSLLELKKLKNRAGRLWVLFGCGGQRDKTKREKMGEVAFKLADNIVITDDNPRGEDPAIIRNDIAKSATSAMLIAGRKKAITETIASLEKDDILLIAGKGHEDYQIIGNKKIYLSDIEVATLALAEKNEKCSLDK
ncbi:MAG TPA: UDP-N-acetylmuramoyl-L-alanyl-D-glutamate--2,6-diaminopimelate ligase [Candidatus Megaira endosymbiont of Nemacystus decipiens]|nr:UDP-N-acetylmuramoyl-L-alanyl-D-glutamate--2,6-diaminopimelate ligase [Candidatus Megaera endosymbiont of Nemacystus decipiens]